MSAKTITNIIIVIVFLLVVGGGYYYLTSSAPATLESNLSSDQVIEGEGPAADVLRLLHQVEAITLDGKIFTNPAFSQFLVNYTTDLPNKPRGRANPFANFGVGNFSAVEFGGAAAVQATAPAASSSIVTPTPAEAPTVPPVPAR